MTPIDDRLSESARIRCRTAYSSDPSQDELIEQFRHQLRRMLPLTKRELEFLDALNDDGEVRPEMLTADGAMQERIAEHPCLRWKPLNVRKEIDP